MRNINTRNRTYSRKLEKCSKRFVAYNIIQYKFADVLEKDENISEIKANVRLKDFILGDNYTSDFLVIKKDGNFAVYETMFKNNLLKPKNLEILSESRKYWQGKGVEDFTLVLGTKDEN